MCCIVMEKGFSLEAFQVHSRGEIDREKGGGGVCGYWQHFLLGLRNTERDLEGI